MRLQPNEQGSCRWFSLRCRQSQILQPLAVHGVEVMCSPVCKASNQLLNQGEASFHFSLRLCRREWLTGQEKVGGPQGGSGSWSKRCAGVSAKVSIWGFPLQVMESLVSW